MTKQQLQERQAALKTPRPMTLESTTSEIVALVDNLHGLSTEQEKRLATQIAEVLRRWQPASNK